MRRDGPTGEALAQRAESLLGTAPVIEVEPVGPRLLRHVGHRIDLAQSDDVDLDPQLLEDLAPQGGLEDVVA